MPKALSGWVGVPAAGSRGRPSLGSPRHHVWNCQDRLLQGLYGKPQLGDHEGDLGLEGTAGGWEGEGERQEEGQSQSLQQAQNWGCISEGGRWQSREAQGSRPQLCLSHWLESWKGGWKLTQGLGVRTGPSQTLKRVVERRSGATPLLPLPSPRQTPLIKRKLSGRHPLGLRRPFPRTPGQTSDPLTSLRRSLLIHWGRGIL